MSNNIIKDKSSLIIILLGSLISIGLIAASVYATSLGSSIVVTNNASIGSNLTVSGSANLATTTLSKILTISSGGASITGPLTLTGSLTQSEGNVSLATTTISGRLGIGTSTPDYTLDVIGNIRATKSLTAGINVETLTGNKTLTPGTDEMYQYLNPNGASRVITLATSTAKAGDRFVIKNSGSANYYLLIRQGIINLDSIYARGIKKFVFDGIHWRGIDIGTGASNISLGNAANGYYYGIGIGSNASGYSYGVAIGFAVSGHNNGVAIGGYNTQGYNYGVAVGEYSKGYTNGTAIGYKARGANKGLAIGYQAGTNLDFTTLTTNENTLIGYKAGDTLTTGNHNLLIGYDIDVPATTTSNYLSIGNLIFGTGMNATGTAVSENGKVGIGTSTPQATLDVQETASSTIKIGDTSKTGCIELGDGTSLYYIYISDGNLVTTTTKPSICQ